MFMDIRQYLRDFKRNVGTDFNYYKNIVLIRKKYPSLRLYKDEDGLLFFCSKEVNSFAFSIDTKFRIDKDGDSILEIYPYVQMPEMPVYTNPPVYSVGVVNRNGFGVIPFKNWQAVLKEGGLSRRTIDKVEDYLKSHSPVDYIEYW